MKPVPDIVRTDAAFARLQALGAGEFAHLNGPRSEHLRNTESLLRRWGSRDALCAAGLYHAVYGTDAIEGKLVGLDHLSMASGYYPEPAK
jgi:hypothetical protein